MTTYLVDTNYTTAATSDYFYKNTYCNSVATATSDIVYPKYTSSTEIVNYRTPTLTDDYWSDRGTSCSIDNNTYYTTNNITFGGTTTGQISELFCYAQAVSNPKVLKFKSNMQIRIKSRAQEFGNIADNERLAIEMLREMISETEFRKFMKYGFILVKGASGKIYQIFRNHTHIKVWKDGKCIEEICAYIKDNITPPTDKLVAFKTMIEIEEEEFRKLGNLYKMAA
jgi:hypothetical protein